MKKLNKRIKAKLQSNAGESIGEVLIALLIAALALTMLASVITTTARLIKESRTHMDDYYDASNLLASKSSGTNIAVGAVKVEIKTTSGSPVGNQAVLLRKPETEAQYANGIKASAYKISDTLSGKSEVIAYYLP